jgi:ATP-dependent Clp protease adaptor protein ClpS
VPDAAAKGSRLVLPRPCADLLFYMSKQADDSGRTMNDELWQREVRARKRDDDGAGKGRPSDGDTVVERRTRPETRTKKPPMYKVILLNDDYTPMEFVVEILKVVFHKQHAEATRIMLHVHQNGMGVAGVFPYEIAETKVRTVEELARQSEFPLKCVMEKA